MEETKAPELQDVGMSWILDHYLPNFQAESRDAVVSHIMKTRLIADAFSTPQGKQILAGVTNGINTRLIKMLDACKEEDAEKIKKLGNEINVAMSMLLEWAAIYAPGANHIRNADGLKKRKTKK